MGPWAEQEQRDTRGDLRRGYERPKHFIGKHVNRTVGSARADSVTEEIEFITRSNAERPGLAEIK